jgi:ATP-dependent Clp protease ATP-binding subunit ClpA
MTTDKDRGGDINITNNFNAPIGQHIDHMDTINFRMDGDGTFHFGMVEKTSVADEVSEQLRSERAERLKEREIRLTWDKTVREKLAREGYDPKYGARPLRRLIQRSVEDTLSEALLEGRILLDEPVRLGVRGGEIVIRDQKKAEGGPARLPQGARVK